MKKYKPKDRFELKDLIRDENIYLGDIDVSEITDMSNLFYNSNRKDFMGIETWDTSKVENMKYMFCGCENFNQPLNFDTSKVKTMSYMFYNCKNFNQPLNFNTSKVEYMNHMFYGCENFNQELNFYIDNFKDIKDIKAFNDMVYDCFSLKNKKRKIILSIRVK